VKRIVLVLLLCATAGAVSAEPVTPTTMSPQERAAIRAKGVAAEKARTEQAAARRAAAEKATADAAAAQKAAEEKLAADKAAAAEKVAAEKAAATSRFTVGATIAVAVLLVFLIFLAMLRAKGSERDAATKLASARESERDAAVKLADEREAAREALQAKLTARESELKAMQSLGATRESEREALQKQFSQREMERDALAKKLAPLTEIEGMVARLQAEASKEGATVADLRRQREALEKTVKALTENLDVMDHGVYQPHFDFTESEDYKRTLEAVYDEKKEMVKAGKAATCSQEWEVNGSKVEGRKMTRQNIKLMLRAFNGEVEAAVANVAWNNVKTMEERIERAYVAINKNGESNRIDITPSYFDLSMKELRLTYEHQRKKQDEKEEQRRIRAEMREEERVREECEKAEKEADDEAHLYERALARAQDELKEAHGAEMAEANAKVEELQRSLAEALAKKERAIAQAQLTKMGHIYVISNIGSFGEDVFKIGMTRRLEPEERIRELGDASVPFAFDIHAMMKCDNAPALEWAIHQKFADRAINLVNPRKEFFKVSLREVEAFARSKGVTVEFTMLAEAREHRETEALRARPQVAPERDSTPVGAALAG
jgi:hypothetical protein